VIKFCSKGCDSALRLVDAHIHLPDPVYSGKTSEIVEAARQAGVVAMVSNSMNLETSRLSIQLAGQHSGSVYAAVGIHPWNVSQLAPNELEQTVNYISQKGADQGKIVAIGEVGLDPQYAKRKVHREQQVQVFREMLRLAENLKLPVIVHSRWSAQKILDLLPSYNVKGVLWHWFSGPVELLPRIMERGDYVSEGPPVVFSERVGEIVRGVSLERFLSETDGPVQYYGPFKSKPTTPAFVSEVVKAVSRVKGIDEDSVAEQILFNFENFFNVRL